MAEVIIRAVGTGGEIIELSQAMGKLTLSAHVESPLKRVSVAGTFSQENIVEFAHLIIKQWGSRT